MITMNLLPPENSSRSKSISINCKIVELSRECCVERTFTNWVIFKNNYNYANILAKKHDNWISLKSKNRSTGQQKLSPSTQRMLFIYLHPGVHDWCKNPLVVRGKVKNIWVSYEANCILLQFFQICGADEIRRFKSPRFCSHHQIVCWEECEEKGFLQVNMC